jgi:hypothetical protein
MHELTGLEVQDHVPEAVQPAEAERAREDVRVLSLAEAEARHGEGASDLLRLEDHRELALAGRTFLGPAELLQRDRLEELEVRQPRLEGPTRRRREQHLQLFAVGHGLPDALDGDGDLERLLPLSAHRLLPSVWGCAVITTR